MSVNSSSSSSDSLLHPQHSSFNLYFYCLLSRPSSIVIITSNITIIFTLLPLCIYILYHGLQQWRSTSSAATMSHADSFTYHMVTMELVRVLGGTLFCLGIYKDHLKTVQTGSFFLSLTWYGEIFFHVLTCVERYLAVVHPITYLSLRKERGVRIRNICIGCAWVLSFAGMLLAMLIKIFLIFDFFLLISSLTVISFCSLSVLRVLIHSGPGEQVGRRDRVDQSKLRAFYTVVTILGVQGLRLTWGIVWAVLYMSGERNHCTVMAFESWFNFPCILVLPLLFLHRTGKLVCCKNNIQ